jgi:hypothetical protein
LKSFGGDISRLHQVSQGMLKPSSFCLHEDNRSEKRTSSSLFSCLVVQLLSWLSRT